MFGGLKECDYIPIMMCVFEEMQEEKKKIKTQNKPKKKRISLFKKLEMICKGEY